MLLRKLLPDLSASILSVSILILFLVLPAVSALAASTSCLPASLKAVLAQVEKNYGKVTVVSTYRRGARVALTGRPSRHASCRAVDFHPAKGRYKAVLRWLKKHHAGGLGTYSGRMRHIHIDDGPRVRFHHAVGGRRKGQRK